MVESLLSLESVSRIYGTDVEVHALHQVSLDIFSGDFMSIVGPSGSGKSTMLGLLGLLDVPTKGNVKVKGVDATSMNDFQRSQIITDYIKSKSYNEKQLDELLSEIKEIYFADGNFDQYEQSIYNMLNQLGLNPKISENPDEISESPNVILPGVGSFKKGMQIMRVNITMKHINLISSKRSYR